MASTPSTSEPNPAAGRRSTWVVLLLTAALSVGATLGTLWLLRSPPRAERWSALRPSNLRYDIESGAAILSPDGETIAFVAEEPEAEPMIWLQPVGSLEAHSLPGTEGASGPFWAPDGGALGYFADDKLRRIDLDSGSIRDLADALAPRGASWGRSGTILFAPSVTGVIHSIPASGGVATPLSKLDESRGDKSHRHPCFLPDGIHYLFLVQGNNVADTDEGLALFVGSVDSSEVRQIVATRSSARYSSSGHLLYLRDDKLVAQEFDPKTFELSGEAVAVAWDLRRTFRFESPFSVSDTGLLLSQPNPHEDEARLTWLDRNGEEIGTVGKSAAYSNGVLSPDEKRLATAIYDPLTDRSDIWVIDLHRGTSARITFESGNDLAPVWSPNDDRIYYYSERSTGSGTYSKLLTGGGDSKLVYEGEAFHLLWSVSPDGNTGWVMTNHFPQGTRWDVEALDLLHGTAEVVLGGPQRESGPSVSPNGKWLAYHSDELGQTEVFVVPLGRTGEPVRVSRDGGTQAEWTKGGREIIFRALDRSLMAVDMEFEPSLSVGTPQRLFRPNDLDAVGSRYDVTHDGERFMITLPSEPEMAKPWIVVENWTAELQ